VQTLGGIFPFSINDPPLKVLGLTSSPRLNASRISVSVMSLSSDDALTSSPVGSLPMIFRSLMRERTPDPQSSLQRCCAHSLFVWDGIYQLHREISSEKLHRPGPIALPILEWKRNHWGEDRIVPCTARVPMGKSLPALSVVHLLGYPCNHHRYTSIDLEPLESTVRVGGGTENIVNICDYPNPPLLHAHQFDVHEIVIPTLCKHLWADGWTR